MINFINWLFLNLKSLIKLKKSFQKTELILMSFKHFRFMVQIILFLCKQMNRSHCSSSWIFNKFWIDEIQLNLFFNFKLIWLIFFKQTTIVQTKWFSTKIIDRMLDLNKVNNNLTKFYFYLVFIFEIQSLNKVSLYSNFE